MATTTVYPEAGAGVTANDGYLRRASVDETFGTIRGGAGTTTTETITVIEVTLDASTTTDQFSSMGRSIMSFDTSSIADTDVVSAVTISLYGTALSTGLGSPDLDIAAANPTDPGDLANGDYANISRTSFGSVSAGSYSTSAYNDISLDSNGIAEIDLTGVTSYSAQQSWDLDNSFGGTWSSGANTRFTFSAADNSGTSQDPKLAVTHAGPFIPRHAIVI